MALRIANESTIESVSLDKDGRLVLVEISPKGERVVRRYAVCGQMPAMLRKLLAEVKAARANA